MRLNTSGGSPPVTVRPSSSVGILAPNASTKLAVSITLPRATLLRSANTTSTRWMPCAVSHAIASLAVEMDTFTGKGASLRRGGVASQDTEPADLRKVAVMRDQGRSANVERRGQLQGIGQSQAILGAQLCCQRRDGR